MKKYQKILSSFSRIITDEAKRLYFQALIVFVSFFVISTLMSIVNIITQRYTLLISTASFMVLCLAAYLVARFCPKLIKLSYYIFMIAVVVLFTFFIITGGTDNFSIVWLLLLPTLGMFFLGLKRGTIICTIILIIMLSLFHIPYLNQFCTDYGKTFVLRFPIVYICSYAVGFLLEFIRILTEKELNKSREKIKDQSIHDQLTGILNRYGLQETFEGANKQAISKIGIAIYDIDHFKMFNDKYGHLNGDIILKDTSEIVANMLPSNACLHRFGGEEFVIVYFGVRNFESDMERIRKAVSEHIYTLGNETTNITISIGYVTSDNYHNLDACYSLLNAADEKLYEAKTTGRNKVVGSINI